MLLNGRKTGVTMWPAIAATILLTGCAGTMVNGDAGCISYGEARLTMPAAETLAMQSAEWAAWVADLDDRMTGTCRG